MFQEVIWWLSLLLSEQVNNEDVYNRRKITATLINTMAQLCSSPLSIIIGGLVYGKLTFQI